MLPRNIMSERATGLGMIRLGNRRPTAHSALVSSGVVEWCSQSQ